MTYISGLLMAVEVLGHKENTWNHQTQKVMTTKQIKYPHWHHDRHWSKSTTVTHVLLLIVTP